MPTETKHVAGLGGKGVAGPRVTRGAAGGWFMASSTGASRGKPLPLRVVSLPANGYGLRDARWDLLSEAW